MFDEAHHIVGDKIKSYLFEYEYYYDTMLFFTATPKNSNGVYMYELPDEINDDEIDLMNDENTYIDDEPQCGNLIYEYFHIDGVEDKILNDFKIRIDFFTNKKNKCYDSIFEAIARSIIESNNTRVLTFHSRSETTSNIHSNVVDFTSKKNIEKFVNIFNNLINNEYLDKKDYYGKITIKGITGKTKNKHKILKDFDRTKDNDIFILSSCQTIGEGVDTKKANHIVFVDPKQSYTSIIQNIGRVTRKNKNVSTVLLPCWVDKEKYKDCETDKERDNQIRLDLKKNGDFTMITNVLSALRQSDPYLFESCLRYPNKFTKKSIEKEFSKIKGKVDWKEKDLDNVLNVIDKDFEYDNDNSNEDNLERFTKENKSSVVILNEEINEEIKRYGKNKKKNYLVRKGDKFCNVKFENGYTKNKIGEPKERKISIETHNDNKLQVLWKISDISDSLKSCYIESTVVNYDWYEKLEQLKKFIDNHKKRPNSNLKNMEGIMGRWYGSQIINFRNKRNCMKNKNIYNSFSDFLNKYSKYFKTNEQLWNDKFIQLKSFIDKNNKKPSQKSKNNEESMLGYWLSSQIIKINKKTEIMKDEKIFNIFSEFLKDYSRYFKTNEEVWNEKYEMLKEFIDKNKRRPVQSSRNKNEKLLISFLSSQLENFKNKKYIMKNKKIYDKFQKFLEDYLKYFKNKKDIWCENFDILKNFINKNDKRPSEESKNKEEKYIGNWLSHQLTNYKKEKHNMKNKYIYFIFHNFLEDYSEYFKSNEDIWYEKFELLKKFIDEKKKRPNSCSKYRNEKLLGLFLSNQIQNYNKKKDNMKNEIIYNKFRKFLENYSNLFKSNEELWYEKIKFLKKFIDNKKRKPSKQSKNIEEKKYASWLANQIKNYQKKNNIMKNKKIYYDFGFFLKDYSKYIISDEEQWYINFHKLKKFMNEFSKRPQSRTKDIYEKKLNNFLGLNLRNFKNIKGQMKKPEIYNKFKSFIIEYKELFPLQYQYILDNTKAPQKSITITKKQESYKNNNKSVDNKERKESQYQKTCKSFSIQNSKNTHKTLKDDSKEWHDYHDYRDYSFKGYDNQDELPIPIIIKYLEILKDHKLNILDLGCGRNLISEHFKSSKTINIIGYDHVSYNGSISKDISNLDDVNDQSIDICIFSQSLMGSNWKEYLHEAKRILRYRGEVIIVDSENRYDNIKKHVSELFKIDDDNYDENKRWFKLHCIKK
jgi:superfamily II DNA or RNA helicase